MEFKGLSNKEYKNNLDRYGYNSIDYKEKNKILKILISQFKSILIIILLISVVIFFFIGHKIDAYVILAIVIVNAIIGFFQEYKAGKAVESLKSMLTTKIKVIRDSKTILVDTKYIVPGDIVILEEGDKIPADSKILKSFSLRVDESILTGESHSILKDEKKKNKVFSGTTITSGKAFVEVEKTGKNTEFGKIVKLLSKKDQDKTLFEKKLDDLSKKIVIVLVICIAILFILGLIRGINIIDLFIISVSLAISAIPEGLPIVITLTLAIGVKIMSSKKAIVRKMSAIESLGATTVICSDKTGTLTLNEMTVKNLSSLNNNVIDIKGSGYDFSNKIKIKDKDLLKQIDILNNCNESIINSENIIGDPTEIALKVLAKKTKHDNYYKIKNEIPFSSDRKMMSTLHNINNNYEIFSKGALTKILKKSKFILDKGKVRKITKKDIDYFYNLEKEYAKDALRVLGSAYKKISKKSEFQEKDLIFVGIVAMIDPPRTDVKSALKVSNEAGIDLKIITGDNKLTAQAIAKRIGLSKVNAIDSSILDKLDDKAAYDIIKKTNIFSRSKPEHKYRIVSLLKENGEIVSVTGDGVNDAPAIKKADVGIAMGIKGTQATKEVADIVLKDDNFKSIIAAIKQGRRIYDNILLFVKYMLAVNFDLLLTVGILTVFALPLPLIALQILWINMVTDSLPAIALGRRPALKGIMKRKPIDKNASIFNKFVSFIVIALIVKIVGELILFSYGMNIDAALGINTFDLSSKSFARTIIFTGIVIFELFFAFICNAEGKFKKEYFFSNKYLTYSVILVLILQVVVLYTPFFQEIFKLATLNLKHWIYILLFGCSSYLIIPINNFYEKNFKKK